MPVPESIGRRSIYYHTTTPPAGAMLLLRMRAEFAGVFGVKEATDDPGDGVVWGWLFFGVDTPRSIRFVGASPSQQVLVSSRDSTQQGAYQLDALLQPIAYRCGSPCVIEPPVGFVQALDGATACHGTVRFTPFPEALGKPLLYHLYNTKLLPGRSYEIRLEGVTPAFNAVLTVYTGGGVAAQSVGVAPADGMRSLMVTPTTLAGWQIEVSSGQPDGLGGWVTPEGPYTLTVAAR